MNKEELKTEETKLKYASEELKNDKELVMEALLQQEIKNMEEQNIEQEETKGRTL